MNQKHERLSQKHERMRHVTGTESYFENFLQVIRGFPRKRGGNTSLLS